MKTPIPVHLAPDDRDPNIKWGRGLGMPGKSRDREGVGGNRLHSLPPDSYAYGTEPIAYNIIR